MNTESTYTGSYSGITYPVRPDTSADAYLVAMGVKPGFFNRLGMSQTHYNSWVAQQEDQYNLALKEAELQYNSYEADLQRRRDAGLNPYWNGASGSGTSGFGDSVPIASTPRPEVMSSQDYIANAFSLISMVGQLAQQTANVRKTDAETTYLLKSMNSRVESDYNNFLISDEKLKQLIFSNYFIPGGDNEGNIRHLPIQISPDSPFGRQSLGSADKLEGEIEKLDTDIDLGNQKLQINEMVKTSMRLDNALKEMNTNEKAILHKYYETIILPSILSGYQADEANNTIDIETAKFRSDYQKMNPALDRGIKLLEILVKGLK